MMKAETFPPRQARNRYLLGDYVVLLPWSSRFRYGWILHVSGPYFHTGIGVVGPDWNDGKWLGGMSWKRRGPIAFTRWRRRGSWRADRRRRAFCPAHGHGEHDWQDDTCADCGATRRTLTTTRP